MTIIRILATLLLACILKFIFQCIYNLYLHPLRSFPGPKIAAASTLWKAYIDCISFTSFLETLQQLHTRHGDVVRVGPNELSFSRPETYHEIYNNSNRWDKEESLYHSFGEDRSSFGYLKWSEAKDRKDILSRTFSRKAIREAEGLVVEKVGETPRSPSSMALLMHASRLSRFAGHLSEWMTSRPISSTLTVACQWM
jgi:hypothetical protein